MANRDMGRVTPIYQGDYSGSQFYEFNDIVKWTDGAVYWHIGESITSGVSPIDETVWKKLCENGTDGTDGNDGKSAYQQAVEGGYEGTESEFNRDLAENTLTDAEFEAIKEKLMISDTEV